MISCFGNNNLFKLHFLNQTLRKMSDFLPEKKMRASVVHRFGDVKNIKLEKNWPIPEIDDNQVLIQVKASSINPVDTYIRSGNYAHLPQLPYIPGREGAGIVEKLGSSVSTNYNVGDRVWFTTGITGACADYCVVESSSVFKLPENASFSQGSTLGIAYLTAYRALFIKARAQAGETVFIHGASGGVGLAAVELAKTHGLTVYGTAGSEEGMQIAKKQGADVMVNHNEEHYIDKLLDLKKEGFDVVLEMLANVNLNYDLILVAKFGRICVIGNRGTVEIDPRRLMQKESSIIGVFLAHTNSVEMEHMGNVLYKMLENGQIKPVIDLELPLSQLPEAQAQVIERTGGSKGKIVINLELPDTETKEID